MSSRYNVRRTNRPRYNREQTISNARSLIEQELREATQSDLRAARDLIDRELDDKMEFKETRSTYKKKKK